MQQSANSSKRKLQAIASIVSRNTFLLINLIIFTVVVLLLIFGNVQEGIFLGLITIINIIIGCVQEINAWLNLEKLQLLAAPRVKRINDDDSESIILVEDIKKNDVIKLKSGDQVPCDGILVSSHGFEVNEGLITGESKVFMRKPGDVVFAGSIVTSGFGIIKVEKIFAESRISLMTKDIKKYSLILSPIQYSIGQVIKYTSYLVLFIILFVVTRGFFVNESTVNIIQNVGALTSAILPQGIVVIVTLFYSYGAIHLYYRNVLLQEINATEKIGRIKNLCMDKTGTLTDNNLIVENVYMAQSISEKNGKESINAYIKSTGDSSQTIEAIKKIYNGEYSGVTMGDLTFSSSRRFGAVHVKDINGERIILAGAPDIFLPFFSSADDKIWVQKYIDTEAKIGKRILCFVQSDSNILPEDLSNTKLSAISIFVLKNGLREGVKEAVQFFQERGVKIRIISGDNPETVVAVSNESGVKNTDKVITGTDIEDWTDSDYMTKSANYNIFARVKPEQKEKIIEALRMDGFTAMIGDGANDALAIKKADLGIAMFDGAQATRQVASIVLVKNSFSDLPNGVKLADSVIQNIEICASIIFNQVFVTFFFFVILAVFAYSFPFTPLNITFINYFTIGLPSFIIFYWIIRPAHIKIYRHDESFLRQVVPFPLISAIPQSLVAVFAFYNSLEYMKNRGPTSLVAISFIILGFIFFMFTPSVYSGPLTKRQIEQFLLLILVEFISIILFIQIPIVANFYGLETASLHSIIELLPLIAIYVFVQYEIIQYFFVRHHSLLKKVEKNSGI